VKDFGKSGRVKWTHLVQEDTTDFQAPWAADTANNVNFYNQHAGGVKEVFTRPAAKKKRTD
jgi:microfibrillar-associated protein 1